MRTAVDRSGQPERAFQAAVIELAQRLGWRVAHFRATRTVDRQGRHRWQTPVDGDGAGFPDLVLARAGRILFVELKTDRGRLSPAQAEWRDVLELAAWEAPGVVRVRVWRPRDWPEIELELARPRPSRDRG